MVVALLSLVKPAASALWARSALPRSGPPHASLVTPAVAVFDLDGCLWAPDMYMLWGGGAPFVVDEDGDLSDCSGRRVRLLGDVARIMYDLHKDPDVIVAIASCTDEPHWARECMQKFVVSPKGVAEEVCIADCIDVEEITKGNKQGHLKRISEATGSELEEMIFFDNERGNCIDVAALGVTVAWVPEGVTANAWEDSLERYPSPGEIFDYRKGA
jgi:magnesium-dependent phosphatase 1